MPLTAPEYCGGGNLGVLGSERTVTHPNGESREDKSDLERFLDLELALQGTSPGLGSTLRRQPEEPTATDVNEGIVAAPTLDVCGDSMRADETKAGEGDADS